MGLARYAETFDKNEIDLDALPHITEDDLKDIGVALGARRKLLAAIAKLSPTAEPTPLREVAEDHPAGAEAPSTMVPRDTASKQNRTASGSTWPSAPTVTRTAGLASQAVEALSF